MNCWKSVNIIKEYGIERILFLALFGIFSFFTVFYLTYSMLYPSAYLADLGVFFLFFLLLAIAPFHKLMHCVPLWMVGKKAKLKIKLGLEIYRPTMACCIPSRLSRNLTIIVVLFPFLSITFLTCVGAFLIPAYMHYFAIFSAINFGYSITDFIYALKLYKAPKHSFIEDHEDGFDILIKSML
jgi:hypothetical protein